MSSPATPELSPAVRESTLARFAEHRRAWDANPALRACYARWYQLLCSALPPRELGAWVELGSGPGFAAEFIPEMILTDIVQAPWHARRAAAEALPFADGEIGALVLFDVLHHVAAPVRFFAEAVRVLRPGGRVLLVEPYISPLSRVIYGRFHPEGVDMSVDPLVTPPVAHEEKDPFLSNQALPTLLFCRKHVRRFLAMFPQLAVSRVERFAGLAYPATGGLSRRPLLPLGLWKALFALESILPEFVFRLFGFRLFVIVERR
ncbi:MAG: class I SAM-dependent methyltransferase [Deltaproteobacteria bacterium]|nr:class I SAM-dependent methyltransferase [Deltaproteobacteria bacterium]